MLRHEAHLAGHKRLSGIYVEHRFLLTACRNDEIFIAQMPVGNEKLPIQLGFCRSEFAKGDDFFCPRVFFKAINNPKPIKAPGGSMASNTPE